MTWSAFLIDYLVFVFLASVGVLQFAASLSRLTALLIFRSIPVARVFGVALAVAAFVWFFVSDTRNVNDFEGGLDANVQALALFVAVLAAVLTTLVVSSLVNIRMDGAPASPSEGVDSLRRTTYFRALPQSVGAAWKHFYRLTKKYSSG